MLHEFTMIYPYKQADEIVDLLSEHELYNVTYEPVIKVIKTSNGYDYVIQEEKNVEIKLYIEDGTYKDVENDIRKQLAGILSIPENAILYKITYEKEWKVTFPDIQFDNGWTLKFKGSNFIYDEDKTILFDPQGAFGTGLHETTKDCLEFILNKDFSFKKVLDLGTGSGILSIASGLKNAAVIDAYDIEDVERQVQYNAALNDVQTISVYQGNVMEEPLKGGYDWIFINIGCQETLTILKEQKIDGNRYLISGLVEWNEHEVAGWMQQTGFCIEARKQSNEWVTILFKKENLNEAERKLL